MVTATENSETPLADPVLHYFAHLIKTNGLPPAGRPHCAKKFLGRFNDWCDDHGHADSKPKNVAELKARVDTLFSKFYHEVAPGYQMFADVDSSDIDASEC